jgi:FkbM family methyltransferase
MRNGLVKTLIRRTVPRTMRNWIRSPSKSLEWIWDGALFFMGSVKTFEVPPMIQIIMHPHAFKIASRAQIADPEENAEFRNFVAYCSRNMFLFDIGAHYGLFSLAAAQLNAKAIAVDPSLTAVRMMARQIALNKSGDRIRLLHAAVSEKRGLLKMLSSGVFSEGYFKLAIGRVASELTSIPAVTIDDLASEFGAPTHIKIDVEGHEAAVLRGGRETLERFSPVLFIELHSEMVMVDGGNPEAALDELRSLGYMPFSFTGVALDRASILDKPIARVVARRVAA